MSGLWPAQTECQHRQGRLPIGPPSALVRGPGCPASAEFLTGQIAQVAEMALLLGILAL